MRFENESYQPKDQIEIRQILIATLALSASSLAFGQGVKDVKDVKVAFRPEIEAQKPGDVEFCVVNIQASDAWFKKHKAFAKVSGKRITIPAVFKSVRDGHNSNHLQASQSQVFINEVPIEVVVEPKDKLELVGVSFETFDEAVDDSKRALVVRFDLRPISEIKNYKPPKPNRLRIRMSSFNKYKPAKPFTGLKHLLRNATPMPERKKEDQEPPRRTVE